MPSTLFVRAHVQHVYVCVCVRVCLDKAWPVKIAAKGTLNRISILARFDHESCTDQASLGQIDVDGCWLAPPNSVHATPTCKATELKRY